jgi:NADP-dependent 3-hydroxy acid dehydrogenase YdfG
MSRSVAVVTGASAGIGAATARRLANEGFDVVLGARRIDRLREIASSIGPSARALALDVTDQTSVDAFCAAVPSCSILVNSAGGALGLDPVREADDTKWRWMFEANVLGTVRMIRALLPRLEESGQGHIVLLGSVAGYETYPGGAGYHAAKYPIHALAEVLRMELLGSPVRVTNVAPGAVSTEFSLVRFEGDAERAARVYEGFTPLTGDDVADCIAWAVTRPPNVNVDEIIVKPISQANARMFNRKVTA